MEPLSLLEIQAQMQTGGITAHTLVESYLARIEAIDRNGPRLNSVIELNPDALAIADALDKERRDIGPRGPMHGIPILLKENIDTVDRMMTTAGSLALEGSIAPQDAFLVQQLRAAGAVILGKANLSEWANFRSSRSSSGWSSRGGLTRNPYALDRSGCGSSTGSAVAVAAGLCAAAVGTETDGSITCPAAINGIVGLKPTVGLVSRSGIIPISHSQDTAGPLTATVADAAIVLSALVGVDARDPATLAIGNRFSVIGDRSSEGSDKAGESDHRSPITEYTQFLDPNGLRGARLGVARQYFGKHPQADAIMEASLDVMRRLGADVVDLAAPLPDDEFGEAELEVLLYEFKAGLNAYLTGLGPSGPIRSLEEIIAFNERHSERTMPYFGQERMLAAQTKGPLTEETYLKAREECLRLSRAEGIDKALAEQKLDAIVAPTTGPAWLIDLVNGDHYSGSCTSPAAVAGYPHITVPAGFVFGLPVGLSFFASAWQEPMLIKLAYAFEQASQARQAPRFLPTVDFM